MVINDGFIEYLGDDPARRVTDLNEPEQCEVVDLEGRSVFASFIDGHMHLLQFGASLVKVGLDDCRNISDIRATIAKAARNQPNAPRILCRGWRQSTTHREALATTIDDIDPRPIFIDADDLHSEWCNTAALREMGISKETPDPVDGIIERDKDGNPTGLISEGAVISMVWPHLIGMMSHEDKIDCIRKAVNEYHASGYTGVVEMAMDGGSWKLLEELRQGKELDLRVAAHWLIYPTGDQSEDLTQVQEAVDMHSKYNLQNSPNFRIAGIKVICDGVVDSCTAALSKPYLVSPQGRGVLLWTPEALQRVVAQANAAKLQVAMHAIGDAAINLAINTLENLSTTGRRHRIEHLELTHPDDAKRLGKLGITASVQPVHSDPSILGAWPELIGTDRCDWAFAYRDFHEHGAQLAIGTDSPTAPHQALPNLYVANARKSARDSHNHHQINGRKGLDLPHSMHAASWGAAYSCFAESITGSLEVGKSADFVVIEGLPQPLEAKALLKAVVSETWLAGRKLYSR